ncbi:MAG: trehalose 2-sulfotransferase [Solirubrobacteraceae bacterium]|jgi:LPS sulfotransferase NodH|nr:trehalose 2-sulfotransferase [Solirubrobacteraceae bacterium]
MQTRSPYLVCGTAKSGSAWLADLLRATGIAGRPEPFFERRYATNQPTQPREFFEHVDNPRILALLPELQPGTPQSPEAFDAQLAHALSAGATSNGVWAAQLEWGYLLDLLRRLKERPGAERLGARPLLDTAFGDPRYVLVLRTDKLAQAAALWHDLQPEPEYSAAAIRHLREQLTNQERAWVRWCRAAAVDPVVVTYEDLVDAPERVVHGLIADLGIEGDLPRVIAPRHEDAPAAWAQQFEFDQSVAA